MAGPVARFSLIFTKATYVKTVVAMIRLKISLYTAYYLIAHRFGSFPELGLQLLGCVVRVMVCLVANSRVRVRIRVNYLW